MKIITVKLHRGRLLGVFCLLAAIILVLVGLFALPEMMTARQVSTSTQAAGDAAQRLAFLATFGWETEKEPVLVTETETPTKLEGDTLEFQRLQETCGLSIANCLGTKVRAYTYAVTNHPTGRGDVKATLWVYQGKAVAGYLSLGEGKNMLIHALNWKGAPMAAESSSADRKEQTSKTDGQSEASGAEQAANAEIAYPTD